MSEQSQPTLSLDDLNFATPQDIGDTINNNNNTYTNSKYPIKPAISTITKVDRDKKDNNQNNNNGINGNSSNNTPVVAISSCGVDKVLCPTWASDPNPTRNDHLKFMNGDIATSPFIIPLDDFKFIVLGRSNTICDYVLSHPTVSRKHCLMAHDMEGKIQIVDLGSSHGTFINKIRCVAERPYTLRHGDKVYLGADATSHILVYKSSQHRQIAESLISKRNQLKQKKLNNVNNNQQNIFNQQQQQQQNNYVQDEEDILEQQILEFYTNLNKCLSANDSFEEIDSLQVQLSQLGGGSSPTKKLVGAKRKTKHTKSVSFNEVANKFVYSEDDQVDSTYPTIQSLKITDPPAIPTKPKTTSTPKKYITNNQKPRYNNHQPQSPLTSTSSISSSSTTTTNQQDNLLFTFNSSTLIPFSSDDSNSPSSSTLQINSDHVNTNNNGGVVLTSRTNHVVDTQGSNASSIVVVTSNNNAATHQQQQVCT